MPNSSLFRWYCKVYPQNESGKNVENSIYLLQWKLLFWNKLFIVLYFFTIWPPETKADLFSSSVTSRTPPHCVYSRFTDTVRSITSLLEEIFVRCYFLDIMVLVLSATATVKIINSNIIIGILKFFWLIFPKYVRWIYHFWRYIFQHI